MSRGVAPLKVGRANGQDIIINLDNLIDGGDLTGHKLQLVQDYDMLCPPGYIARQGVGGQIVNYEHRVPAGTVFITTKPEATALIAAGAAVETA